MSDKKTQPILSTPIPVSLRCRPVEGIDFQQFARHVGNCMSHDVIHRLLGEGRLRDVSARQDVSDAHSGTDRFPRHLHPLHLHALSASLTQN